MQHVGRDLLDRFTAIPFHRVGHGRIEAVEVVRSKPADVVMLFDGAASLADLVRDPAEMCSVLHSAYPLPVGAWLLTGTGIVPDPPYTATEVWPEKNRSVATP